MADIKVTNTNISGLFIIEPTTFYDNREALFEAYNDVVFASHNLDLKFVQDTEVKSKKGVLRGMHINVKHPQGKLIRVIDGEILDVVIDLRKESPTYMSCYSILLSNMKKKLLYIPEGMGHGYLALQDSRVLFKTTTHYIPGDELGFSWNSKAITADWGVEFPIQNDRDKTSKDLSEVWK
ncbi:MAG: dTDP-4-dehydrorhamnose 3,5-epimerase [Suipraeoptans sp.]